MTIEDMPEAQAFFDAIDDLESAGLSFDEPVLMMAENEIYVVQRVIVHEQH